MPLAWIFLEQEGVHILLASEIEPVFRKTITANRPRMPVIGDIEQYTAGEIRRIARLGRDEDIHLVVGGPPCQAFSSAGRREGFTDPRGNVFLTFIDRIFEVTTKIRG